jgi:hypothetical protein
MNEVELRIRLQRISSTYPRWMDHADVIGVDRFRRVVKKAADLSRKHKIDNRWKADAAATVIEFDTLRLDMEQRAPC